MTDKLKSSSKAWIARQARWRHNGFIGSAKMMQAQCNAIIKSPTTTTDTKNLAAEIKLWAGTLALKLKERID